MAVKYWTGQAAIYEISFDTGTNTPVTGETLNVVGSAGETCIVQSWTVSSGAWATNDAAGNIWVYGCSTDFVTNFASGDDLENSSDELICNSTSEETLKTGDVQAAGNWGVVEDVAIPVADDEVIFDSRSSETPTGGMLDSESGATAQATLDLLHFKSGYTGGVGSVAEPLCTSPDTLIIEGTGTYYILCGLDDQSSDTTIGTTIINNASATVYLYSNCNDTDHDATFTNVYVLAGTVTCAYYTQDADTSKDTGCIVDNLYIAPKNDKSSNVTVTIEKDSFDSNNASTPANIYMSNGTLTTDSKIGTLEIYKGTVNYGTDLTTTPETDLDITTLRQYGGTLNWYPDDAGSPTITTAWIFGGSFVANGTTNNNRDKTITTLHSYNSASVNLANNKANITVTNWYNHGATVKVDTGGKLALTYNQP